MRRLLIRYFLFEEKNSQKKNIIRNEKPWTLHPISERRSVHVRYKKLIKPDMKTQKKIES